jgi:hypothetical protein
MSITPEDFGAVGDAATDDAGYATGQRADFAGSSYGDVSGGYSVRLDSTNVTVTIGSGGLRAINPSPFANVGIDETKWQLYVKAWKFA